MNKDCPIVAEYKKVISDYEDLLNYITGRLEHLNVSIEDIIKTRGIVIGKEEKE